jgi:hypothetical protein
MNTCVLWKRLLIGCILLTPIAGCVTATSKTVTVSPTDTPELTSCEEVEGICLELTFDGESCTYEGPTLFKSGPVTLLFLNESEGFAAVDLLRHNGDQSIQDMIDYFGEEPSTKHHPSWSTEFLDVWGYIESGNIRIWRGALEPGIHTMVCVKQIPNGVWFGTGLTVED